MIDKLMSGQPFIIAEMSGNHDQSLETAKKIVKSAAEAGADAIKLQTYTAETMTMKGVYKIEDKDSLWNGNELYDLYEKAHTPWDWHEELFKYAKELELIPFSTPFDFSSVDFLEELNVDMYKIASFENTDIPLIKKVAKTGKPVIISTGAASLAQIDLAVSTLRENGCDDFVLLKCTSTYPAPPENTNLRTIPYLKDLFKCPVGLSDHTLGIGAAVASIAMGARVIEKHFTLDRSDGAVDAAFSLEPDELKMLVEESKRAYLALGDVHFGLTESETKAVEFKRSVYVSKDIKEGDAFTTDNTRIIRPGFGLEPKYYDLVLGKKAKEDIQKGTPLSWDILL
jgi:pseudaminic acid synthase